jgi:hypothetical protein
VAEESSNILEFKNLKDRATHERRSEAEHPNAPLQGGGGGGTYDGMEARVAKLESSVEHIQRDTTDIKSELRTLRDNARTDFRVLFGAIIAVALGLAGLMAKGFHWF